MRSIPGGYMGKILHVDLTKQSFRIQEPPSDLLKAFIGGSGLGAKLLNDETGPATDPLGPENPLIFMTGPFTGTKIPLSGRHEVVAKSPLTGLYGEADAGGMWGTELKKAGYDGIVVRGRASRPTYIWISDGSIEFRGADHLWGMDTYDADGVLKSETERKAVVSCIGPAGERLARIAGVMHDGRDGRPAARCGLGAVMGSKLLKAIVAKGDLTVPVSNDEALMKSIKEIGASVVKNTRNLYNYGTAGGTVTVEQLGDLPIKNWRQGRFEEGAQRLSGQTMASTILSGKYYCGACIVGCGREVKVEHGRYAPVDGAGPEYETVSMLGAMNLVDDLAAVSKAHELCNRYGLDVISTGAVISFALECFENGLVTGRDTGGVALRWGDGDVLVEMVHQIGRREGLGWLLGEGVRRASVKIGRQAVEYAIHTRGLEFPGHDPRAYNSLSLGYATSNRGACHLQGFTHIFERSAGIPELGYPEIQDRFGVEGKWEFTAKLQNLMCMMDSLKLCKFIVFGGVKVTPALNWLNSVTGWGFSQDEFMTAGERIYNLKRMYNVRCGSDGRDDRLPERVLTLKRREGGAAENLPPFEYLLEKYYQYRGWDSSGTPRSETLSRLGLTPGPDADSS